MIYGTLLPKVPHAGEDEVVLFAAESTRDVFDRIQDEAPKAGYRWIGGNLYQRGPVVYVGYWTTPESVELAIGARERGFYGGPEQAAGMRRAYAFV